MVRPQIKEERGLKIKDATTIRYSGELTTEEILEYCADGWFPLKVVAGKDGGLLVIAKIE